MVQIKSEPQSRGAVLKIIPSEPENRIEVFINREIHTYYASQLIMEQAEGIESLPREQFHAYLSALQIKYPGLSTLFSLNSARIDFIPYQFRPALKFITADRPRLLIADDVGVGKTIEAGLILRELQARGEIRSVLIICPRPLITESKWMNEMKRFDEQFTHLDGETLRYCISELNKDGAWPEQYSKVILPYSLLDERLLHGPEPDKKRKRGKGGLLYTDPPPRFDLVIVDEAHHIRNQNTYSHEGVRFFCDYAEAAIFLTATPIQLGRNDLFVLLNVLRPDLIIDSESFSKITEPNEFINRAVAAARGQKPQWFCETDEMLKEAESTYWGRAFLSRHPSLIRIRHRLSQGNISNEERVQIIDDLESMHTLNTLMSRTRRKDIGDFTVRRPETIEVPLTHLHRNIHDMILRTQAEILSRLREDVNINFMMTTIRRQAASCLHGLAPFLEGILTRRIDELEWEEAGGADPAPSSGAIDSIRRQIEMILEMSKSLGSDDAKLDAVRKFIREKQRLANNKIMLFSCFRHTLGYIYRNLMSDGFRVGMIHGGTPDEERVAIRERFANAREERDSLDVLLFSEIGCEGLDYQFCDCIVNYDLPWNPMRIEQRIGRIDRNGQKSQSIAIINLITPGTVDADIYERCLLRIGVFNRALGGSEEILGEITREIRNIAENFALSPEERQEKFEQLADNKIRLRNEQEQLERRQMELFGIRLPEDRMKREVEDASSFWVSANSLQRLATLYLQKSCGAEQGFILGENPLKTLRLSQEAKNALLSDFNLLSKGNNSAFREWEKWLRGSVAHLPITFESKCAVENPKAAFITALHPLVKQAAAGFHSNRKYFTTLKAVSSGVPAGRYEFAVYLWRMKGIREDVILRPVASSPAITEHLTRLLENATDAESSRASEDSMRIVNYLESEHQRLWSEARDKHRNHNRELAKYQKESLAISHRARIALLDERLSGADNEKIKRMRQSQIDNANADYNRRIESLNAYSERADILADTIAYGIIEIHSGEGK
ncbi:MAG: DEAD/DEAH box helicase [Deltaproteobacteria bacterium]